MRVKSIFGLALIVTLAPAHAFAQRQPDAAIQGGYSTEPLREPIFDMSAVLVRTTAIHNWLASNIQKLNEQNVAGPRENLYYLIDSKVKQIYAGEKRVLPKERDPILAMLFSWSESLGVYGGAQVFNALKGPDQRSQESLMPVPAGMNLRLDNDMFALTSRLGWSVRIPYYFMITGMNEGEGEKGIPEQVLMVSTGAARDKSVDSHSQATLLFIHAPPTVPFDKFENRWLRLFEMEAVSEKKPLNVHGLNSRHVFDPATKLHKEVTAWNGQAGSFVVLYSGIDGTYQWNRAHFLDFVRSIETGGASSAK